MQALIYTFSVLLGLVVGSFLNVVIYRMPRGLSLVRPGSQCPECKAPIRWYDNVPLLSWISLKGRCRKCDNPISVRYPLVEGFTGLSFGFAMWRFDLSWHVGLAWFFIAVLICLALIDLDHMIIPSRITLPGAAIGLCVRSVEMCPGTAFCKLGQQDSMGLGLKLDERYHGMDMPGKLKFAVTGCPMNCVAAPVRDIGIQGRPKAWRILVGGCLGPRPRFGKELCLADTEDQVLDLVETVVSFYRKHAKHRERMGRMLDRVGWEAFVQAVLGEDKPGKP